MTPLAARLTKQVLLPERDRDEFWKDNRSLLQDSMTNIHCFEVTEVLPLLPELQKTIEARFGKALRMEDIKPEQSEFIGRLVFLPAPKTWIEYRHGLVWHIGLLLEEFGNAARVNLFTDEAACNIGTISLVSDDWRRTGGLTYVPPKLCQAFREAGHDDNKFFDSFLTLAHCCLVLINSPTIIGRRQVMPNVALERRLTRGMGKGKFPLHAWTELKLHVAKPIEIDDGEPHEAHLTGRRALHFVRKHIRIRLGRLEYVSAHWRGDPAIGIKQTRYVVTQ